MQESELVPAALTDSFEAIQHVAETVEGLCRVMQIDIIDGRYAARKTWPYTTSLRELEQLHALPVACELDLMIAFPEESLSEWLRTPAERIVVHLGSTRRLDWCLEQIADAGKEAIVALQIGELPVTFAKQTLVQGVQCMGIRCIGRQGEPFDSGVYDTIAHVRALFPDAIISVDGGVTREALPMLRTSTVRRFVVGSAIMRGNIQENIRALQQILVA